MLSVCGTGGNPGNPWRTDTMQTFVILEVLTCSKFFAMNPKVPRKEVSKVTYYYSIPSRKGSPENVFGKIVEKKSPKIPPKFPTSKVLNNNGRRRKQKKQVYTR